MVTSTGTSMPVPTGTGAPLPAGTVSKLAEALSAAARYETEHLRLDDALRDDVRDYARELRAQKLPPEKVVVHIKGMLERATEREDHRVRASLGGRVVSWCIEEYFRQY